MPVCFGWKEFAIATELKCYPSSPSQVIPTLTQEKVPRTPRKGKGKSSDREDLVSIVGPSFKNKNLIEALKDPKVVDGIKIKLFGATTIRRKIILEGGLVAIDDGSGNGAAVGDNDAPLTVFETTSHYDYDHTDIDAIFYYLQNKVKLQTQEQYRYTTGNYLYKVYINNAYDRYCHQQSEVSQNEECLINIIKGFSILAGLPWPLVDEVYIPINCGDELHWVLAIVVLKERRIRVYDSMS
ncbi:hypothetical protein BC332_28876 [Capsicum chinense]|nr:hypothetical protein BC332_28876 [Capsicum chinense]